MIITLGPFSNRSWDDNLGFWPLSPFSLVIDRSLYSTAQPPGPELSKSFVVNLKDCRQSTENKQETNTGVYTTKNKRLFSKC
jgi:hypothetical protein